MEKEMSELKKQNEALKTQNSKLLAKMQTTSTHNRDNKSH